MPNPAALTDMTSQNTYPLTRPNNSKVILEFNSDPARPYMTRLTLPRGSTWTPDPHWHEQYTEYLRVVQGRAKVILDGVARTVTADDGPQVVEKFVVHEFMRLDHFEGRQDRDFDDEEVVVEEWTDPADGAKQIFFRNAFGVLEDTDRYWGWWMMPQVLLICATWDNPLPFLPNSPFVPKWATVYTTHAAFALVKAASWVLGLKTWYEPYTPVELRARAARG